MKKYILITINLIISSVILVSCNSSNTSDKEVIPESVGGSGKAETKHHPIPSVDPVACTDQFGESGVWYQRLPHFKLESRNKAVLIDLLNSAYSIDIEDYEVLEQCTRALFKKGTEIAAERGLILVDTKYEFGKTKDGKIVLIDEIHTPDSSRYFYADGYEDRQARGEAQKQLSKEFVRQWLIANGFQGLEGQTVPEMSEEKINEISERYIELYENITGENFVKSDVSNITERIEKNVLSFLNK